MKIKTIKILFLEDEVLIPLVLKAQINKKFGDRIHFSICKNFIDAEKEIQENIEIYDHILIFSDYNLGKETADHFLIKINHLYPKVHKVIISSFDDFKTLKDKANILKILSKPWNDTDIFEIITNIVEKGKAQ